MSSPFDRLMNTAKMRLPGAVDDAMRQELFEVCIDFFKDAAVWEEQIEFTLDPGGVVARVTPVAGRLLKIIRVQEKDARGQLWMKYGWTMPEEGLILSPHPREKIATYVGTFMMTVTDPVTRDAYPIMPLELVGRHHDVLLDGLLAKMMSHPSKPYTNVQMASYHQTRFRGGVSRARNSQNTGNVVEGQNWRFPTNFA